ncbi:hypothetical protein ARMGADRAFT_1037035 [Armillaria gallica]|uniref:F-box domain-containing protein n=1 Tax=Armillaria gallica TaxID=47427 RepID=A0A2H3CZC2_ARMGA|nr:hypothetical protein ARMGADRAFT_1037035 [Armillaria gallica]
MADFSPETTIDVPSEIIIRILKTRTLSQQDLRSSRLACKQWGNCGFVAMLRKVTVIRLSEVAFYIDYFQKRSLHASWVKEIEISITIQCNNGLANWSSLFTLLPNLAEVHIKNTRLSIFDLPWTSKTTLPLRLTFTNCIITTRYAFNVLSLPHIDSILIVGGDSSYSPQWDDSFSNLGGKTRTDIRFIAFDELRFNDASDIAQAISECSIKPKAIHWHVTGTCDPVPQSLHIGLVDHILVMSLSFGSNHLAMYHASRVLFSGVPTHSPKENCPSYTCWTLRPNLFDKSQNTYPRTWKLLYVLMPPWKSAMQSIELERDPEDHKYMKWNE